MAARKFKDAQALGDEEIRKVVTEGKDKMKPVKDLSAADLTNVIAFVHSLVKKQGS